MRRDELGQAHRYSTEQAVSDRAQLNSITSPQVWIDSRITLPVAASGGGVGSPHRDVDR